MEIDLAILFQGRFWNDIIWMSQSIILLFTLQVSFFLNLLSISIKLELKYAPQHIYIYSEETYIHTQLALSNYQTFRNIIDNHDTRQSREVWMFLQSFLSHFGMVSKLLYAPSRSQRAKNRAQELKII